MNDVKTRPGQYVLYRLFVAALVCFTLFAPAKAVSAPYAAMVIDARTGEVLHSRNADTRLHPASLTKMMTLYVTFEAIKHGEISLDTVVKISKHAASEPPSKLGLKPGQQIKIRYLIRATAVKSANDAATALGEAISGSEAAFARRMNRTARALGMTRTTFKNMNGLTEAGHLSTARDMTTLGRHLFYDYPGYYNLFSRRTTDAGVKEVNNTNGRLLAAYRGADGIKTGYTRAAGYNLVASAKRGNERIIATVFGGRSSATRNAKVAELLDMGFSRAPSRVAVRKPRLPPYSSEQGAIALAATNPRSDDPAFTSGRMRQGKTVRVVRAVTKSMRPPQRPATSPPTELLLAMKSEIQSAVEEAQLAAVAEPVAPAKVAPPVAEVAVATTTEPAPTPKPAIKPTPKPVRVAATTPAPAPDAAPPAPRPTQVVLASLTPPAAQSSPTVVTRLSTSGGRHWGINIGRYNSHYQAERVLLKTALKEMTTLEGSLRKVVKRHGGFDANFVGMSQETAELACRRLRARDITCIPVGPS